MSQQHSEGLRKIAAALIRQQRYADAKKRYEATGSPIARMDFVSAKKALVAHDELPPELMNDK